MLGEQPFWNDDRLNLYAVSFTFAAAVTVVVVVLAPNGVETASGRLGGDFPALYGASGCHVFVQLLCRWCQRPTIGALEQLKI